MIWLAIYILYILVYTYYFRFVSFSSKVRFTERKRELQRSVCWFIRKLLQRLSWAYQKPEARNLLRVSHAAVGAQNSGIFSLALPGQRHQAGRTLEQLGHELARMWNPDSCKARIWPLGSHAWHKIFVSFFIIATSLNINAKYFTYWVDSMFMMVIILKIMPHCIKNWILPMWFNFTELLV